MKVTINMGIDEAGRGPVIGPMVLAAVGVRTLRDPLFELPLRDSKKLTRRAREVLFCPILEMARLVLVEVVPPRRIDQVSLTAIWMEFVVRSARVAPPRKLFLDAPVSKKALHATENTLSFLLRKQKTNCKICLAHKADERFPLVSAASIVAKICRDALIQNLKAKYGDFGSGYPSDPKTRTFVKQHRDLPIIRKKWKLNL